MKGRDVIVLQVDLDEGLPVVVALVQLDAVEGVPREVEVGQGAERNEVGGDMAAGRLLRCFEQHPVPALQRVGGERAARVVGEVRCTDELAGEVVGPAVQRTDDVASSVAAAAQHDGLTVPADVGDQSNVAALSHQAAALAFLRQGMKVAARRHRQFVADIARRGGEQAAHLALVHIRVEVAGNGELGATRRQGGRGNALVGHGLDSSKKRCRGRKDRRGATRTSLRRRGADSIDRWFQAGWRRCGNRHAARRRTPAGEGLNWGLTR